MKNVCKIAAGFLSAGKVDIGKVNLLYLHVCGRVNA